MGQRGRRMDEEGPVTLFDAAMTLLLVGGIGGFVWLMVSASRQPPPRQPDFMVSITGVDGLILEATSGAGGGGVPTTLSPVLNLTVHIYNPSEDRYNSACVRGLSTAVVSYGDAFLGKGSVPPFCAEEREAQERVATAWGEDVVLPRFLRERLSAELERGEAALDVQVAMPGGCSSCSDKVLVCSKVKIGGSSPSPCRVEWVRPMPAAGSTSTAS